MENEVKCNVYNMLQMMNWTWIAMNSVTRTIIGILMRSECCWPKNFYTYTTYLLWHNLSFHFVFVFGFQLVIELFGHIQTDRHTYTLGQKYVNYDCNLRGVKKPCQCKLHSINSKTKSACLYWNTSSIPFWVILSDLSMSVHFFFFKSLSLF